MRVLVTGGLGFIGSATARALLEREDQVTILDALTPPVHADSSVHSAPEGARVVVGDVRDEAALDDALSGVDAIIHLAAYQDYRTDYSRFFDVNARGTALLIERIAERGGDVSKLVVASSQAVYGEGAVACTEHGVVIGAPRAMSDIESGDLEARCSVCGSPSPATATREELSAPTNAYGISKLAAEAAALRLGEQIGVPSAAIRYAIVQGVGQSPRNSYSGILRAATLMAIEGKRPIVFEDGLAKRDYVSITDAVNATLTILDAPTSSGRTFNCGGARPWSVIELLEGVERATGLEMRPEIPGLARVGDVRHTLSDTSALRSLGWQPSDDLEATWRAYIDWLASQGVGAASVEEALAQMEKDGVLRPIRMLDQQGRG